LYSFIAHYYDEGIGGAKENKSKAFEWYKKAAEAGIELIANDAQFHIAQAYDKGEGVGEDKAAAFKQYRKAADAGHTLATYRIAQMYDEGEGVNEDRDEAKLWYRKVRDEKGVSSLLTSIGNMVVLENIRTFKKKVKDEEERIQIAREKAAQKAR
jgi:TPR repeat protein